MVKKGLKFTMANICIFASGQGSNVKNIIEYFRDSNIHVNLIVTDRICDAIKVAENNNIENIILTDWIQLVTEIKKYQPDLIVLAGFIKLVPKLFLDEFKVVNIHPSLLPKFGGKGMWGLNVHKAVIESGDTQSGITIHWVNSEYDKGEIISQFKCQIIESDTPEVLQNKIKKLEKKYYPEVIKKLLS